MGSLVFCVGGRWSCKNEIVLVVDIKRFFNLFVEIGLLVSYYHIMKSLQQDNSEIHTLTKLCVERGGGGSRRRGFCLHDAPRNVFLALYMIYYSITFDTYLSAALLL